MNKVAEMPRVLRNKYFRIAVIALVVFIIVWIIKGIGLAVFVAAVVATVLVLFSFDPRIKRHW